jgi:hypothetical protein
MQVLNRTGRLREYYQEQRRLQVAADLASPHAPFLESYQPYLAQVGQDTVLCKGLSTEQNHQQH